MDWEPATDSVRPAGISSSGLRPSEVMARMIRESTPSRELAPSLSTLSLLGDKRSPARSDLGLSTGRTVPFAISGLGISRSYAPSLARSRFSTVIFKLKFFVLQNNLFSNAVVDRLKVVCRDCRPSALYAVKTLLRGLHSHPFLNEKNRPGNHGSLYCWLS